MQQWRNVKITNVFMVILNMLTTKTEEYLKHLWQNFLKKYSILFLAINYFRKKPYNSILAIVWFLTL